MKRVPFRVKRELAQLKQAVASVAPPPDTGGGSVDWSEVTNKPTLFSGAYSDLSGRPSLFSGSYNDLSDRPSTFSPSSHSHTVSDVTGLQTTLDSLHKRAGTSLFAPLAGAFIPNSQNATALGTQAAVANRNVIAPFVPAYGVTIDQMGVSVSTLLASNNAKCVIYDTDSNGRPTTILRESGLISTGATGTPFASITPITFTAGKTYWIGVRMSGTFTLRTLSVSACSVLSYTNAATPVANITLIATETFANAAGNWVYSLSQHSNTLMPLVLMRLA